MDTVTKKEREREREHEKEMEIGRQNTVRRKADEHKNSNNKKLGRNQSNNADKKWW